MLKILRDRKTAKKIWIGLGIIIMPAFIFWGFGGAIRDKDEKGYIGKIAKKNISVMEFKDSINAVRNLAIMQYGENLEAIEKNLNLETQAWQRLALLEVAKKSKIRASDKEVIAQVTSYPFFMQKGKFDNRTYKDVLKYVFRTQPRAFEEQTRQNIIISKLYHKKTDGITIGENEIRDGYIKIKTANNPKFKIDEKKFLSEKKEFEQVILEEKKQESFSKFIAEILK
jgi:hypothetical protein